MNDIVPWDAHNTLRHHYPSLIIWAINDPNFKNSTFNEGQWLADL